MREVLSDSAFSVFCVHLYKSKRTKPCILLSELTEISGLILETSLYVHLNDGLFSAAYCVVKQPSSFYLETNNLSMRFSNATSVAYMSESSWFNNILTHYSLVCLSIPPENIRKPKGFMMFSGSIDKQHRAVMG